MPDTSRRVLSARAGSRVAATQSSHGGQQTSGNAWRAAPALVRAGRCGLLVTSAGLVLAGMVILILGMTALFVPQDLAFMHLDRAGLDAISPRLIPLIAHDRAGFGGGLMSTGLLLPVCAWHAPSTRAFRQTVALAGLAGFGCAIGVHFVEGYTDVTHLSPAVAGAILFAIAIALESLGARRTVDGRRRPLVDSSIAASSQHPPGRENVWHLPGCRLCA